VIPDAGLGLPDPFGLLADAAGKVVADGWTAAMLGLWNAGLWALRVVLTMVDALLTPDLSEDGPAAVVYRTTFWLAGALVLVMLLIQVGLAAAHRNARNLATVLVGLAQFLVVWAAWVGFGVAVVTACGGLTRALMATLLKVDAWSAWQPWQPFTISDGIDGTVATVLGLLGLVLWLAAVAHLLVMLTRAGALVVLAALTPAAAAGLVSDAGRSWFWKSLRWFLAAAFAPVLMVLMLGVGVQLTTGVATGLAAGPAKAVGTALPGVLLILIASVAPLALFKLLAFVDPNTSSGAALRTGLADTGGVRGLLAGAPTQESSGGPAGPGGRSSGEAAADDATAARLTAAQAGLLRTAGGAPGNTAASALGVLHNLGSRATAVGSDLTNQMGVGHYSYHPDLAARPQRQPPTGRDSGQDTTSSDDLGGDSTPPLTPDTLAGGPDADGPAPAPPTATAAPGLWSNPSQPRPAAPGGSAAGPAGTGAGAAGGAEAAAAVPIVPV